MINRILKLPFDFLHWLKSKLAEPAFMVQRLAQAYLHGFSLKCTQNNTARIGGSDILLFCCLRNEAVRIPWFLDYYRKLGVRHFLFVDNGSDDGFAELVASESDVSVWHTTASYRKSNFGMHWLNRLLRKYGNHRWCVTCDPDEFLVYPYCDTRNLYELAEFLESEKRRSLCCFMLDTYSDKPVEETVYTPGDDPFEVAPYFDGNGYIQNIGWLRESWVTGGVRRRVFFNDMPRKSPALNKTPFVKWRWSYSYYLSMHQLVPAWLNRAHPHDYNSVTGCVMHFKHFSLLQEKVDEEMVRKQHWDDSFEYRKYSQKIGGQGETLQYEKSQRFEGWQQLVSLGFMNMGTWF